MGNKNISKETSSAETPLFMKNPEEILKTYKTIRIAVSGDVSLNKLEIDIIDTHDFQRLRSIKSLGSTYLVYPTAVHTRFDHSLGTLAMSYEMIRSIRENKHNSDAERTITPEQEILIRLLALLHDICHIPFGHTLEDEFCIFPRHDEDLERTERFLGKDSEIGKLLIDQLSLDMYTRFFELFTVNKDNLESLGEDLFIYDIVNNTVCADLLDYLRRDCYFCNVVLDTDYRFLKYLYIRSDNGIKRIVVRLWKEGKPTPRRDILNELVRLLDNRYLLGERVYFHHAKLISGTMIAGAVQRATKEGELKKEMLYEMGDDTLLDNLAQSKIESVRKLAFAIKERKMWKNCFECKKDKITTEQGDLRDIDIMNMIMSNFWENAEHRYYEEERVSALLGMDSADILIHCPNYKMAMKLAEMKVFWNGNLQPLKDCKDDELVARKLKIILDSHTNLWAINVYINPQYIDKKDDINIACEFMFSFNTDRKETHQKLFYNKVVDQVSNHFNLQDIPHPQYEKKKLLAIERLSTTTDAIRDKETVEKIIKDSFAK